MIVAKSYLDAFQLLADDFRRAQEYVEPTDDNLLVYSHRLYELLLRACTEFESLCRDLLVETGSQKPVQSMNVLDYRTLEGELQLEAAEVGVLTWSPTPAYVRPFKGWSSGQPPLSWYADYNQVKHNRHHQFKRATLQNVRSAVAAQFALLASTEILPLNISGTRESPLRDGRMVRTYPGYQFSLVLAVLKGSA